MERWERGRGMHLDEAVMREGRPEDMREGEGHREGLRDDRPAGREKAV